MNEKKQTRIDYYFGNSPDRFVKDGVWSKQFVQTAKTIGSEFEYKAILEHVGEIGDLTLYEDNQGGIWLNNIEVHDKAQRCGIATRLVLAAIQEHGRIYASRSHQDGHGGQHDTRRLTEEGAALVNYLIQRGIMNENDLRNPII